MQYKHACHYCGEGADTKDHIVARRWLPRLGVPQYASEANKVPACQRCNGRKSHFRALCSCVLCETAWVIMAPYLLPRVKRDIPPVSLAYIRGEEVE